MALSVVVAAIFWSLPVLPHGQMSSFDASIEGNGVHYLMIGNSGAGKSTILNSLYGRALFKSGITSSGGMTQHLQRAEVGQDVIMDTPGLADVKIKPLAAQAITRALKERGLYKIFFVVTLEHLNVRPEDRATIELVLRSAPISEYGVIFNKLEGPTKDKLLQNKDGAYAKVVANLMRDLPNVSLHFHFNSYIEELAGATNVIVPPEEELIRFIDHVPAIEIRPEDVRKIKLLSEEELNQMSVLDASRMKKLEDAMPDSAFLLDVGISMSGVSDDARGISHVFAIDVTPVNGEARTLMKRFNDFYELKKELGPLSGTLDGAPFPLVHNFLQEREEFVNKRRTALAVWLQAVLEHRESKATWAAPLLKFLGTSGPGVYLGDAAKKTIRHWKTKTNEAMTILKLAPGLALGLALGLTLGLALGRWLHSVRPQYSPS